MQSIDPSIVCCYLYPITKYGYPPPAEQTEHHVREMHALGFRSIELEGIHETHLLDLYARRDAVRETLEALGMRVPYFCAVLPGLSSPDGAVRDHNLGLLDKGCEIARDFGALGVLDNAPLPPYQFPGDLPVVRHYEDEVLLAATFPKDLAWSAYWHDLVATYQMACDIAAGYGLTYQLHPCLGVLAATTDGFLRFFDAVGRDNLRFNLDTANQFVQKDNLALSLRRLADHVDYIHLSDNGGQRVEHLAPGDGVIHWESFFETLDVIDFDGHVGIDIGGPESRIADLDRAYLETAAWLMQQRPLHYQNVTS